MTLPNKFFSPAILAIVKHVRKSEAEVLRMLHMLRSHEKRRKARFGSLDGGE